MQWGVDVSLLPSTMRSIHHMLHAVVFVCPSATSARPLGTQAPLRCLRLPPLLMLTMCLHCLLFQADEIVELCDNAEKLFKQEKSVLELRVSSGRHVCQGSVAALSSFRLCMRHR
eukprot:GHUV01054834.1.p1 GENE.GHUV01054834.1~~GHUV01054834.1.p1  ORF type:complete len:115 (-),score=11.46 GHUV01054834.1:72-416(-)